MARCGCSSSTCNCVISPGTGTTVSGAGQVGTPYRIDVSIDQADGNLLESTPQGLRVDCDAVAACVAEQSPNGQTEFNDSPGVDMTRTGSGTADDPYQVSADLTAVYTQTAPASFSHALTGAAGAWSEITELGVVTVPVAGTYLVSWTGRGSAAIPAGTAPVNTSTSVAVALNDTVVPGTETELALTSQGTASGGAEPALQTRSSGSGSMVMSLAAGDELSLYGSRQPVASGTNSIISNTDGRCRITIHRIGA